MRGFLGLGFRVWVLRFGVLGCGGGFRVSRLSIFGVKGLGALGFRVWVLGFRCFRGVRA